MQQIAINRVGMLSIPARAAADAVRRQAVITQAT
jgi:hypothetical protein